MKKLVLLAAMMLAVVSVGATESVVVRYAADNKTVFRNPERGFTDELNGKVTEKSPYRIKDHISDNWGTKDCMTMPVVLYNYGNFKSVDLPDAILKGFDEDMQELRRLGLKCVLRFAYTERESDIVDATPEWVKRHLEQLKPHLAKNADVIYVLEAGFVGVWGEWYYSKNYGNETQHVTANRRKVIEYLFENAPEDRFILFRYPMIKTEYLGDETPLSTEEGFSGSVRARMGCHNDAFLHDWGNMGTYASDDKSDDPAVRQYIATETLYVPNGGETNIDDDDKLAEKRYVEAPSEMSKYHWSFCGSTYATPVTRRWRESGLFDTLNVHMGYRYNLLDATFSREAAPSGKANVTIRIRNVGYAPIYNERPVWLVFRSQQSAFRVQLSADPRRWLPNGEVSLIREQVEIPAGVQEGTYHLYLWLPDKYESIANDPRYAVRLANHDVWDAETGYNDLNAEIVISKEAPQDPGPLPEGLEEVEGERREARGEKVLRNGIVYVMSEGTMYDLNGRVRIEN